MSPEPSDFELRQQALMRAVIDEKVNAIFDHGKELWHFTTGREWTPEDARGAMLLIAWGRDLQQSRDKIKGAAGKLCVAGLCTLIRRLFVLLFGILALGLLTRVLGAPQWVTEQVRSILSQVK